MPADSDVPFDVIIIRGAPGIGKSTVGELLRNAFRSGALIDLDQVRRMSNAEQFVYDDNEKYYTAIKATAEFVKMFLAAGICPVVVVDVFARDMLRLFLANLAGCSTFSVSLVIDDVELQRRMSERQGGYKELAVAGIVNRHIDATSADSTVRIDISQLSPHAVKHCLLKILRGTTKLARG